MRAVCLRIGGLMNQAELGRDVQVPRPTVHRHLNLLETSFQLVRLDAFAANLTKRLIKAPKLYWSDPGLALHLASEPTATGFHLEDLVLMDLLAWRDAQVPRPEVLHWRTVSGQEVDLVVEHADRLIAVEVEAAKRVGSSDLRGLKAFRDEYGERFHGGLLLHDGEDVQWLSTRILGVPWHFVV